MIDKLRNWGLGLTELIIVISLVAIAVIAVYGFFGDAIRNQAQAVQESNISMVNGPQVQLTTKINTTGTGVGGD